MKNILVVYYTNSGNSQKVAEKLATKLEADCNRINIQGQKEHINFVSAFFKSFSNSEKEIIGDDLHPGDYNHIVLVAPIWSGRLSQAINSYILKYRNSLKNYSIVLVSKFNRKNIDKDTEFIIGRKAKVALNVLSKQIKTDNIDLSAFDNLDKLIK